MNNPMKTDGSVRPKMVAPARSFVSSVAPVLVATAVTYCTDAGATRMVVVRTVCDIRPRKFGGVYTRVQWSAARER